jgi:TetR/AcrR family transcriptional regulator, cholesterol catabolism regulator
MAATLSVSTDPNKHRTRTPSGCSARALRVAPSSILLSVRASPSEREVDQKLVPGPRPRTRARFGSRRAEIVDVAAALFARNGYAATGIAEIGETVDLALGALYYYIGSKESILAEIHDRVMDPLLIQASAISALDAGVATRLRLLSEALLRQIIERRDHVWVFLHEYRALTGDMRKSFLEKRARFEATIMNLLEEGSAAGALDVTDFRVTTLAFLGMHNYTYQWIHSSSDMDPIELSKTYCDIFLGGISPTEGATAGLKDLPAARNNLAKQLAHLVDELGNLDASELA